MDYRVLAVSLSLLACGSFGENISSYTVQWNHVFPGSYELRLVGGPSRCEGELQMKQNYSDWRWETRSSWSWVSAPNWSLRFAHMVCVALDCGSALYTRTIEEYRDGDRWDINPDCDETHLRNCVWAGFNFGFSVVEVKCSESVRLLSGPSLCSGPLQILQNQSWTWVCEGDLDLPGSEVVCRELGCGAPLLQGALSPLGQTFQCEGYEYALMDCPRSRPESSCSSARAVHLTCSDPDEVRLQSGSGRCDGTLQLQHQSEWRNMEPLDWTLMTAAQMCRRLDCGTVVSSKLLQVPKHSAWQIRSPCAQTESSLRECVIAEEWSSESILQLTCSESVRLLSGPSLCSGPLQILQDQSWTWVCEGDLDLPGEEVVCRELGCGPPLLQGALSPLGQTFYCEGHESSLMDCPRSRPKSSCSSARAVHLTCSAPSADLRLVGQSRCAGTLEVRHQGQWRPVVYYREEDWGLRMKACEQLLCGSVVTANRTAFSERAVWTLSRGCALLSPLLPRCVKLDTNDTGSHGLHLVCSDMLPRPNISVSAVCGVQELSDNQEVRVPQEVRVLLGSDFRLECSVEPQFPGGFFELLAPAQNHTRPAVNHSAHFLFTDAGPAHTGVYTCVYHLQVFNHNFSSQSRPLQLSLGVPDSHLILRVLIILMLKIICISALCWHRKIFMFGEKFKGTTEANQNVYGENEWEMSLCNQEVATRRQQIRRY